MDSVSTALSLAPPVLWPQFSPELQDTLLSIGVSVHHEPVHIYDKKLFQSDIDKGLGRFSMIKEEMKAEFLSVAEERGLMTLPKKKERGLMRKDPRQKKSPGLDVKVIDPSLRVLEMKLKGWKIGLNDPSLGIKYYALNKNWNTLVDQNGLVVGDEVNVWSFRYNGGSLGLVLIKEEASSTLVWGRKRKRSTKKEIFFHEVNQRKIEAASFSSMDRSFIDVHYVSFSLLGFDVLVFLASTLLLTKIQVYV